MNPFFYLTLILNVTNLGAAAPQASATQRRIKSSITPLSQATKGTAGCVFPEDFFAVAQSYSRRFGSWQLAFEKNYPKEAFGRGFKRLFTQPRKFAKKKHHPLAMGALYLGQLRDHLRGLYEASLLEEGGCSPEFNKTEFIHMLNQAWPQKFCTRFWGWVDGRKDWVVKYLEENEKT